MKRFDSISPKKPIGNRPTGCLIALLLSATGLFAVLADSVARRRGEIGLRQALGASPKRILVAVVSEAAGVVLAGMGLGALLDGVGRQTLGFDALRRGPERPLVSSPRARGCRCAATVAAVIPALRAAAIAPADALRDG